MLTKGFVIVYLACFFSICHGQDASIVSVSCNLGNGRGCVVEKIQQPDGSYLGKVLTASHVVEPMQVVYNGHVTYVRPEFTVKFSNGETSKALSITDERKIGEGDIAFIVCKIPACIDAVELAEIKEGENVVWHLQSGNVESPIRVVEGKSFYCDLRLRPGDSGGPVSKGGRIVGVVSGGWFWVKGERAETWPARAGLAK